MATLAGRGSGQTYPFPGGLGPELFEPHFLRYGQEPAWASGATYLKHPGTRQEVEALREVLGRGGEAIREEVSDAPPPLPLRQSIVLSFLQRLPPAGCQEHHRMGSLASFLAQELASGLFLRATGCGYCQERRKEGGRPGK